jgi:hypothetical protein
MKSILAALAIVCAASAAPAATISYDLTAGGSNNSSSLSFTNTGVTMGVTSTGGTINRNVNGFGVGGTVNAGRLGLGEALTFSFSEAISSFTAAIFETGREAERFGVRINGLPTLFTIAASSNGTSFTTFNFASLFTTPITSFSIFGVEPNAGGNRGVRVSNVTVTTPPPIVISPVPLPAGLILLLTALGAITVIRRRTA